MLKKLLATTAISALLVTGAMAQSSNMDDQSDQPAAEDSMSTDQAPAGEEAQSGQEQSGDEMKAQSEPMDQSIFLTEQSKDQVQASRYIGQTVYNRQDEAVGDINDLIFSKDGGIDAAVIGVGGFIGIGEKQVAVSFDAIDIETVDEDIRLVIDGTKEELEAAPEFIDLETQKQQAEAAQQQQEMQQQQSGTMSPDSQSGSGSESGGMSGGGEEQSQ